MKSRGQNQDEAFSICRSIRADLSVSGASGRNGRVAVDRSRGASASLSFTGSGSRTRLSAGWLIRGRRQPGPHHAEPEHELEKSRRAQVCARASSCGLLSTTRRSRRVSNNE